MGTVGQECLALQGSINRASYSTNSPQLKRICIIKTNQCFNISSLSINTFGENLKSFPYCSSWITWRSETEKIEELETICSLLSCRFQGSISLPFQQKELSKMSDRESNNRSSRRPNRPVMLLAQ